MFNVNKNVWVFHHYATPPTMNGFIRPYNFAVNMNKVGYKTTIFTASYLHFSDKQLIDDKKSYYKETHSDVDFLFVNTPSSISGTVARVKNMLIYYFRLINSTRKYSIENNQKPDVIYASSPHPLALIAGIKVAKRYKIPCIVEVRDLWPETIFAFGKAKENSIIGKLLIKGEHWIYKKSSAIVFLKEGDIDYLRERDWLDYQGGDIDTEKCYYINNGVDIENFNIQITEEPLYDDDLASDKFKVIYTGAIRPINNVGNILDAAKLLQHQKHIQFLIFGDGNQREILQKRINDEKISNVVIKGYIDKKHIPYILSKSSINLLNYSQSKYNWSRGNSSNKFFEYMASGKPIISTVKMGYSPIEKYNCGISLDKDTPEILAEAILKIYNMEADEFNELSENAKNGAKDFDYKKLTDKLISVMESQIR